MGLIKNLSGMIQRDNTSNKAPNKCVIFLERLCSNLSFYLNEIIPQGTLRLVAHTGQDATAEHLLRGTSMCGYVFYVLFAHILALI